MNVAATSRPSTLPRKVKSFPCRNRLNLPGGMVIPNCADTQVDLLLVWIDAVAVPGQFEREARVQREVVAKDQQVPQRRGSRTGEASRR